MADSEHSGLCEASRAAKSTITTKGLVAALSILVALRLVATVEAKPHTTVKKCWQRLQKMTIKAQIVLAMLKVGSFVEIVG